jgi:hypothetical protein
MRDAIRAPALSQSHWIPTVRQVPVPEILLVAARGRLGPGRAAGLYVGAARSRSATSYRASVECDIAERLPSVDEQPPARPAPGDSRCARAPVVRVSDASRPAQQHVRSNRDKLHHIAEVGATRAARQAAV